MPTDRQPRLSYPHVVHLPTPEGGWGVRQREMADWCRERFAPGSCHFTGAWHFRRAEDAEAFRRRWAPAAPAAPAPPPSRTPEEP